MREVDSIEAFRAWLREDGPAAVQALDLTPYTASLCALERPGSLFLACRMEDRAAGSLVQSGAVVVPDLQKQFTVHRAHLYRAEQLYKGYDPDKPGSFENSPDQRVYREFMEDGPLRPDLLTGFARALHDHSISDALDDVLTGQRVVAIMGGHGLLRADPRYREVVVLAKKLAELGYLLASGGGPGAMEATHLGAWLAGRPDADVDTVLNGPFTVRPSGAKPGAEYADPDWLARAWRVRQQYPRVRDITSVGIPTWLYGHEPPTPFATHIAKYFANSVREDGVLAIATHGVIFAPGSAGTTQEIFQDACQNHYGTTGLISPMVLLDAAYWTEQRPVWPLLETVSRDRVYGELVALVDTAEQALACIQAYEPRWYEVSDDPVEQLASDLRRLMKLRSNWTLETHPASGTGTKGSWETVLDWLYAIGDDDWIDRDRGARVLPKLFAGIEVFAVPGGIETVQNGRITRWTAELAD